MTNMTKLLGSEGEDDDGEDFGSRMQTSANRTKPDKKPEKQMTEQVIIDRWCFVSFIMQQRWNKTLQITGIIMLSSCH